MLVCISDVCICVCERERDTERERSFPQSSADMVVMGTNEHGVPATPPDTLPSWTLPGSDSEDCTAKAAATQARTQPGDSCSRA